MISILKHGTRQFLIFHDIKSLSVFVILRVEYENHFLIERIAYNTIRVKFPNIVSNTNFPNLLTHHSYGDLALFILKFS